MSHGPALSRQLADWAADVTVDTPVVDRELNAHKYIVPGLGDFGDRLYGTTNP